MIRIYEISWYLLICIFSIQIIVTNSRTSTLWKLNPKSGKIISLTSNNHYKHVSQTNHHNYPPPYDNDPIFEIISSTVIGYANGRSWRKQAKGNSVCTEKYKNDNCKQSNNNKNLATPSTVSTKSTVKRTTSKTTTIHKTIDDNNEPLDCGQPVNFTYYDDLIGVAQRYNHPNVPEHELVHLFLKRKSGTKSVKTFDLHSLEKRLKKAKRENPRSIQLYNQIGNFWRIKGDAKHSIECYRLALAVSPTNSEVLLNLAKVLFNLHYLDDAIHLTRRSLEVQPPDRSAWRQYFTLGKIFKAYGHFQESVLYLRHALDLHPEHEPIRKALRDVENIPSSKVNGYTLVIIACLVTAVLLIILTSNDKNNNSNNNNNNNNKNNNHNFHHDINDSKGNRHINRIISMRSAKGYSSRSVKHRKY